MATNLYWVVYASTGSIPSSAQVVSGQNQAGVAALYSGSVAYTAVGTYDATSTISGLSPNTSYKVSWAAYDGSNYSTVVESSVITTLVFISRPASDFITTGWTSTTGSLAAALNETTPSDAEYITSGILSSTSTQPATMVLDNPLSPGNYNITVRGSFLGTKGALTISLTDGTTLWTSSPQTMTGMYTTYTIPITISGTATKVKLDVTT